MLYDLRACRFPHTIVTADVVECRVERRDPVRYAYDPRVETYRHYPTGLRSLAVKRIELPLEQLLALVGSVLFIIEYRDVIRVVGVWN